MMQVYRFNPSDARSWALWPMLEARVREFCRDWATDTPPDALIASMRKMFVETPTLLCALIVLDETETIRLHCVAWADVYFNEPYLLVHQIKADDKNRLTTMRPAILAALRAWADELNEIYRSTGAPQRIVKLRLVTERPDAWARYLHGRATRALTVMTIPVEALTEQKENAHGG